MWRSLLPQAYWVLRRSFIPYMYCMYSINTRLFRLVLALCDFCALYVLLANKMQTYPCSCFSQEQKQFLNQTLVWQELIKINRKQGCCVGFMDWVTSFMLYKLHLQSKQISIQSVRRHHNNKSYFAVRMHYHSWLVSLIKEGTKQISPFSKLGNNCFDCFLVLVICDLKMRLWLFVIACVPVSFSG